LEYVELYVNVPLYGVVLRHRIKRTTVECFLV
jgi:hypothetical protein